MDEDETMTEAEIDERTPPIGNAIHALAQAELASLPSTSFPQRSVKR
ncbi:hypothetical protein WKY82_12950 [Gordonia malaquae]